MALSKEERSALRLERGMVQEARIDLSEQFHSTKS